ncbi:MAG: hypothetical protein NT113_17840 [Hyphomicrobiales bacterium]|nr:hypothetical protein [Hyphomicrobiales bacterium]
MGIRYGSGNCRTAETLQRFTMREAAMHQQINKIDVIRVALQQPGG